MCQMIHAPTIFELPAAGGRAHTAIRDVSVLSPHAPASRAAGAAPLRLRDRERRCRRRVRAGSPRPSASRALALGESLTMTGKPLGHTTARYAHLANDPVKSAANRIASRITDVAG